MRDNQYPGRSVVMSTRGMIAASQPMATQAGLAVLQAGGNAMDAAVAASAVLCVTEPQATGIGGDCFLLYHEAKTGKLYGLNGSGRAPARAPLEELVRCIVNHGSPIHCAKSRAAVAMLFIATRSRKKSCATATPTTACSNSRIS